MKTHRFEVRLVVLAFLSFGLIGFAGAPVRAESSTAQAGSAADAAPADAPAAKDDSTDAGDAKDRARRDEEGASKARERARARTPSINEKAWATQRQRLESLDLTDEQRKAVEDLPRAQAAWNEEHGAQLERIRDGLSKARAEGDMALVQQLTAERQRLFKSRPGMHDVLTPEQQGKLREQARADASKRAAKGAKGPKGPKSGQGAQARGRAGGSPEVEALRKQIREAERDGDTERAQELMAQLRQLKQAVRAYHANGAGKPSGD